MKRQRKTEYVAVTHWMKIEYDTLTLRRSALKHLRETKLPETFIGGGDGSVSVRNVSRVSIKTNKE